MSSGIRDKVKTNKTGGGGGGGVVLSGSGGSGGGGGLSVGGELGGGGPKHKVFSEDPSLPPGWKLRLNSQGRENFR